MKYCLFRDTNTSDHYYVVATLDFAEYKELHGQIVKLVKEFDNLKEAIKFKDAINLLWRKENTNFLDILMDQINTTW